MNEYKVGDTVVLTNPSPDYAYRVGQIRWRAEHDDHLGKIGHIVVELDAFDDYVVGFGDEAELWCNRDWLVPQFKVGDRVKIHRPETEAGRNKEPVWMNYDMNRYDGNVYTITKVLHNGYVRVGDGGCFDYNFHPRWLELVKDEPQPAPKFAVGDLVKVTKPKEQKQDMLTWLDGMTEDIETITVVHNVSGNCKVTNGNNYWYDKTWLTKVDAKEQQQPKFQVGQKVRIKSDLSLCGAWYTENAGKVCEVTQAYMLGDSHVCNLSIGYAWHEDWLEAVDTTPQHSPETILSTMAMHFNFTIKCKGDKITVKVAPWHDGEKGETRKETFGIFDMPYAIGWLIGNAREMHETFNDWYTNYGE